jgi:cation:H+ antiporter
MVELIFSLLGVCVASWVIAKACDGFEAGADYLGRNMGEGMKGATINAIGSSMPELCVTFVYLFLLNDTTGFAGGIGTTAGSAVFNAMIIPACVILVVLLKTPSAVIKVSRSVIVRDGLVLIGAEVILIYSIGDTLTWGHGLLFMGIYIAYAGYMVLRHKLAQRNIPTIGEVQEEDEEEEDIDTSRSRLSALFSLDFEYVVLKGGKISTFTAWLVLGVSTMVIAGACHGLVMACEGIGHALSIHGFFIAVVLASAASSVPDTILSMKDAKKGNYDDAVANAMGSNIFDVCFALGLPLFAYTMIYGPITMEASVVDDILELRVLLLLLTVVVFVLFLVFSRMSKKMAVCLFGIYGVFVGYVVCSAINMPFVEEIGNILRQIGNF